MRLLGHNACRIRDHIGKKGQSAHELKTASIGGPMRLLSPSAGEGGAKGLGALRRRPGRVEVPPGNDRAKHWFATG